MSFKMFHTCPCNNNKKNSMIGFTKVIKNGVDNRKCISLGWNDNCNTYLDFAMQVIKRVISKKFHFWQKVIPTSGKSVYFILVIIRNNYKSSGVYNCIANLMFYDPRYNTLGLISSTDKATLKTL